MTFRLLPVHGWMKNWKNLSHKKFKRKHRVNHCLPLGLTVVPLIDKFSGVEFPEHFSSASLVDGSRIIFSVQIWAIRLTAIDCSSLRQMPHILWIWVITTANGFLAHLLRLFLLRNGEESCFHHYCVIYCYHIFHGLFVFHSLWEDPWIWTSSISTSASLEEVPQAML